jgi:hypothetical protein
LLKRAFLGWLRGEREHCKTGASHAATEPASRWWVRSRTGSRHPRLWFVRSGGRVMAEVLETEEVRQWRAKVTTFNFDVDCVGGTMTGLLQRAMELEQERVALGLDDMAVVDAASAQKLIDRATALRGLASRDPL